MTVKRLFLDDIRHNFDALQMLGYVVYKEPWEIVRNYDEFKAWIQKNGLPDLISFDHDLADTHYTPKEYWSDYHKSAEYQASLTHTEKTGLDCAKWLVDYCLDNELKLPKYLVHSANPVGRDNIFYHLKNFEIFQKTVLKYENY